MFNACHQDALEAFTWTAQLSHQDVVNVEILASVSTAICFLGIIGNCLTAVVLHKVMTTINKGVRLLKYLSIVDIVTLFLLFLSSFARYLHPRSMRILFVLLTPFSFIAGVTVYTFEIYLTVLIAIERCLAVAAPVKFRSFKRDVFINRMLIVVFVFSVLYNIPHWIAYQPQLYWGCNLSMRIFKVADPTYLNSTSYKVIYHGYVTLVIRSIIPMVILIVCNVILVISRRRMAPNVGMSRPRDGKGQLTVIIIMITCVSVITHLLSGIINTIQFQSVTLFYYVNTLHATAIAINSSVNFVVCCSLARDFRRTFTSMCKKDVYKSSTSKLRSQNDCI